MVEIFGYISALIVGLFIGLLGGGGSILSVPVFAYFFQLNEKESTAYSLFVVGLCALIGGVQKHRKGFTNMKYFWFFGLASTVGVLISRIFIVRQIPLEIFVWNDFVLTRRMLMFGFFALVMLLSAYKMIKGTKNSVSVVKEYSSLQLIFFGMCVGMLSGFVGAGGGFIIVPILTLMLGLNMKTAVGTSLLIIAFQSLSGFMLSDALLMKVNWLFLGQFSAIAITGIFVGNQLSNKINAERLKKFFGYFIVVMAIFIFVMEFIIKK